MSSSASSSAADPDLEPLRRAFKSVAVALKESGMPFALAGGYAAWVGYTLLTSYHGTPFGDSGLRGDSARLAAMATRFSETWQPVDGIVPSVPAGYPPLFPWLVGRASAIIDKPAAELYDSQLVRQLREKREAARAVRTAGTRAVTVR